MRRLSKLRVLIVEIIELCNSVLANKDDPKYQNENIALINAVILPEFSKLLQLIDAGVKLKKYQLQSAWYVNYNAEFKSIIADKVLYVDKKYLR